MAFHPVEQVVVLRPVGDLDIDTVGELRAALAAAEVYGAPALVVDLADVGFMDSTAFGQIAVLVGRRRGDGCDVIVANARPVIRNALRVLGLDRRLEVHAFGDPPQRAGVVDTTGRAPWD